MKELSVEEKARAYDEAIKKAAALYKASEPMSGCNVILETLFPELKSEDEKIRKRLITDFGTIGKKEWGGLEVKDILAWLEKQGEQKHIDKIEPKFKIGDWIINPKTGNVLQIKNVLLCGNKGNYEFDYSSMPIESVDKHYHLWTLEDAKDGDVLACKDELILFKSYDNKNLCYYCWYNGQTNNFFPKDTHTSRPRLDIIVPATKEQRELLFKKMKEAGYEWDAEKKELKKFHIIDEGKSEMDYCFTKMMGGEKVSSAWSEEDEELLKWSINNLTELKDRFGEEYGKVGKCIDWLKSLKGRGQPKQEWSEEDNKIMNGIIDSLTRISLNTRTDSTSPNYTFYKEIDWLKSLRPQNAYNPYKAVVESIAEMCKHYDKASHSGLRDFYDNVKVKCKDAQEYDKMFPQNHWKPSDEQIKVCKEVYADILSAKGFDLGTVNGELNRLEEGLKKLKK